MEELTYQIQQNFGQCLSLHSLNYLNILQPAPISLHCIMLLPTFGLIFHLKRVLGPCLVKRFLPSRYLILAVRSTLPQCPTIHTSYHLSSVEKVIWLGIKLMLINMELLEILFRKHLFWLHC